MSANAKPPLKWAGGKTKLVPEIQKLMPARFNTYYEPFVGGGALFFATQPKHAILTDINEKLISTYRAIKLDVEGVISRLKRLKVSKQEYLRIRERNMSVGSTSQQAAEFIYLNKTCFNGLFRVNSSGQFNTPFGDAKADKVICDEVNLRAVNFALKHVMLQACRFECVLNRAEPNDFVYFDPPYAPLSPTSNFTGFSKQGFGDDDQRKLRDVALELKKRGVHVIISNSAAPIIYELYGKRPFKIQEIKAARAINSDGEGRGKIKELLIT